MEDNIQTHIISISGSSADELQKRRESITSFLQECKLKGEELGNVAYSLNTSYENLHPHRLAVVGKTYDEILQELENAVAHFVKGRPPKLCFLYSGHGSQYLKMAHEIYFTSPTFRYAIEQVQDEYGGVFTDEAEDADTFYERSILSEEKLADAQNGLEVISATAYALQRLWEFWGILPDCVLGSSVGEVPAAIGAGIFRMAQGIEFCDKLFALAHQMTRGGMIALFMNEDEVTKLVTDFLKTWPTDPDIWVDIAVVNCPTQTVVSLSEKAIPFFCGYCMSKGIKCVELPIPNPFHSRGIDPIVKKAREALEGVQMYEQRCDFISSVEGKVLDQSQMDMDYWAALLRNPVHFDKACHAAYLEEGARVFLEIGAHPVQSALMEMNVATISDYENDPIVCLPSLKKGKDDWTTLMNSFAKLYLLGYSVNFHGIYAPYKDLTRIKTPIEVNRKPPGWDELWIQNNNHLTLDKNAVRSKLKNYLQDLLAKSEKRNNFDGPIPEHKHFRELGFSSLQLLFLKTQIQDFFKIQIRFSDLVECTTLEELAKLSCRVLEDTAKGLKQSDSPEEIELTRKIALADFHSLPAHIKRPDILDKKSRPVRLKNIKTLFVTGGTGNMGPFFIQWLCRRKQTDKVYCLVRGENGLERLVKRFKYLELEVDTSKITVVKGCVYDERFGLEEPEYEKLSWEVDAIVNSASCTNHLAKYKVEDLNLNGPRAVNLIGTIRVLEFACFNRIKWLYQASTGMASSATKYIPYEKAPEEWPNINNIELIGALPLLGYPMSKFVADHLIYQATRRGIPAKVFRFPKVGNCKDIPTNHFMCKFLHFFISGEIPAFDISLQILSGADCANLSLRTFFNKFAAASDVYNVVSPYGASELDMVGIGNDLGPKLRFMVDAVRIDSTDFGSEPKEITERKKKLAPVIKMLDDKYGESWIDNPDKALQDESVKDFIKQEYSQKMQYVDYMTFLHQAEYFGIRSPLFPWIEYYSSEQSAYQRLYERDIPEVVPTHLANTVDFSGEFLRHGKLEQLWGDEIFEIVKDPLTVVKKDVLYCITNAKKLFSHPVASG